MLKDMIGMEHVNGFILKWQPILQVGNEVAPTMAGFVVVVPDNFGFHICFTCLGIGVSTAKVYTNYHQPPALQVNL